MNDLSQVATGALGTGVFVERPTMSTMTHALFSAKAPKMKRFEIQKIVLRKVLGLLGKIAENEFNNVTETDIAYAFMPYLFEVDTLPLW